MTSRDKKHKTNVTSKVQRAIDNWEAPDYDQLQPQLPEGKYEAVCYGYDRKYFFRREILFLKFRISGGAFDGTDMFMSITLPNGRPSVRTKFMEQWVIAMGRRPAKGERITIKSFLKRMYKVKVRTVTKNYRGQAKPSALQYSVVDHIIEPLTGVSDQC